MTDNDMSIIKQHKLAVRNYKTGGYDTILGKKKTLDPVKAEVTRRINEYRQLWSNRLTGMRGKMGGKQFCIDKLTKLLKSRPGLTFEEILRYAELYTQNYRELSGYLIQADYFISKNGTSKLEALLDDEETFPTLEKETGYGGNVI